MGLEHRSALCAKTRWRFYREFKSRGIQTRKRPFVGNRLWVVPLTDPDGYRIDFESPTEVPAPLCLLVAHFEQFPSTDSPG